MTRPLTRLALPFVLLTSSFALAQSGPPPPLPPLPPSPTPQEQPPSAAPAPAPTTPPAAPAPAAEPAASAQVSVGTQVEASTQSQRPPSRPSDDYERRVVVFSDGSSPQIVSTGDRHVGGPLELEIRFKNPNPLCYAYSTNIGVSRVAASDLSLPPQAPVPSSFGAVSPKGFADVDEAFAAVTAAQGEIEELEHAARFQVSLDEVWTACDGGADFATQRARVESAAATAAQKLGPQGTWRERLENAEATALGARRLARQMEAEGGDGTDIEARRAQLREAERRLQDAGKGQTQAQSDIADAQRRLREAELKVGRRERAQDLARAADRLSEQSRHALLSLALMATEINRARALLAQSPTAVRSRFGTGEKVAVVVERRRLERGERVDGRPVQRFQVPRFETLHPLILDIGIGPALAIGENTARYRTVWSPRSAEQPDPTWRVLRTEQGLNLDLMVSFSVYLWKRRYLDERVFDAWQLIPRPMVGISLDRPFDVLYAGAQIDPIKYLNIAGGVRIATTNVLVGPQPTDPALIASDGEPQPPVTRDEIRATGFVALTVSTNLLYSWFKSGL